MRVIRTVAELRSELGPARRAGRTVGLVPTMGALHEGHAALIRAARAAEDVVVVSVFVNPTQFDDAGDLAAYPRTEAEDAELASAAGADLLFAPQVAEVYPEGFATSVALRGPLTETLEGEGRGTGHFDGVTTVVAKLFAMASPDAAYFGEKDAQQLRVVRRMARDLNLPLRVVGCPTVRDADGLALSSRNRRLDAAARRRALGLSAALRAAAEAVAGGRIADGAALEREGLSALRDAGLEPEYLRAVDPDTFEAVAQIDRPVLLVAAARVGDVRLIDNLPAAPAVPHPDTSPDRTEAVTA